MIRFRKKFKSVDFGSKKEIDFPSLGHKKFSSNIQKNIMRCNIRKPKLIDLEKSCRVLIFISKILHLPDFVNENNFSAKKYRHFLCLLSPNFMHKIRKKKNQILRKRRIRQSGRWSVEKTDSQTNRGENTLINLN